MFCCRNWCYWTHGPTSTLGSSSAGSWYVYTAVSFCLIGLIVFLFIKRKHILDSSKLYAYIVLLFFLKLLQAIKHLLTYNNIISITMIQKLLFMLDFCCSLNFNYIFDILCSWPCIIFRVTLNTHWKILRNVKVGGSHYYTALNNNHTNF